MQVSANVFDPIQSQLDQAVFNGTDLRYSVQKFVVKTYFRALDRYLGVQGTEWADLYFTGSLTTYQYSETSDADHSVFPNYELIWKHLNIDPDTCRKALIEMSIEDLDAIFIPGTLHPIQYFVMPYGTHPHDVFKPGLRSAWDYFDRSWIVPPERERVHNVQSEFPDIYQRAAAMADKMTQMLDAGNYDAAKDFWHDIHAKRMLDQRAGLGDFSEGNIVLKWLLHEGLIDRLRNEAHMVIQTSVTSAWEGNRWVGTEAELFHILDTMSLNHPSLSHPETPEAAEKLIGFMTTGLNMAEDEAQQSYAAYVNYKRVQEEENRKHQEWIKQRNEEISAEMDRVRLETDKWYKELDAQYGAATDVILHRFDALKPPDAPPFSADRETAIQYAAEQGWEWKFIISRGHGAWVWADAETHDYNGLHPHSEAMVDLMNLDDMPKPDNQNMALGWIQKPPLEEGDEPYRVIVRGGDGWSDEEILQQLGLEGEGTVDREGSPMVLRWYGKAAALPHLWDDRVTTKVIYDFDQDRLVLGTQATLPDLPGDNKIVGEYLDGKVTLYEADKQWINPTYFRRLWHYSYPHRELKDVYFRRETGDEYKLKSLPRKRKED